MQRLMFIFVSSRLSLCLFALRLERRAFQDEQQRNSVIYSRRDSEASRLRDEVWLDAGLL